MDSKFITEILKAVGLPGLVVVAWLVARFSGQESADDLMTWGLVLLAASVITFLSTRSKSLVSEMSHVLNDTLHISIKPLVETVHNMTEIEDKLIDEITALKDIYEGGLTSKQLKFLMPRIFDTFKWRILKICINITTPKGHIVFDRKNTEDTVIIQVCSSLAALAEYNHILKQTAAIDAVHKAISRVFDVLYGQDFIDIEDYRQRVNTLVEVIMTELDLCSQTILNLMPSESLPMPADPTGLPVGDKE